MFAQIIQSWKTLLSKSLLGISAHVHKNFHVSIMIWHICQLTKSNNNGAQNTSTYLKRIIQIAISYEFLQMHAKNFHASIKDMCVCANNPALEDFVI